MISIVKTLESFVRESALIVKAYRLGKSDVRTGHNVNPAGIDANPIKGMKAVYIQSEITGRPVIVGYINQSLAGAGEVRLFSTNADGEVQNYVWLRSDGKIRFGGTGDNLISWADLNTAVQQAVVDINIELAKIAVGVAAGGGSYTVSPLSVDLSASKILELEVP